MDYQPTGQPLQSLTLTLKKEASFSPDRQGVRTFEALGGKNAAMNDFSGPYLAASAQAPAFLCIARLGAAGLHAGYLLAGTPQVIEQLLPNRTPQYTPAEVYAITKKANLGTCTLKRLR